MRLLLVLIEPVRSQVGSVQMGQLTLTKNRKKNNMNNTKLVRVSFSYKSMVVTTVVAVMGWIISCMTDNKAFPKPPIPLVPPEPPDPTQPLDMTTRMNNLASTAKDAVGGGVIQTGLKNAALEAAYEGLDANGLYVQTMARTSLPVFLTSGYQAMSTNRAQSPLDPPSITGIDNDTSTQLAVHLTTVANALGYEVQLLIANEWTTVKFSAQARTIILIGLTSGTVQQVRARALGGSTGQSDWCMPGSSMVD
jgi:hypothetical protein